MHLSMPDPPKKFRFRPLLILVALILLAAIGAIVWHVTGRVSFEGHINESTLSLSPGVAGNVQEILVQEGQTVRAGQPLLLLDPASYREVLAQEQAKLTELELLVPPQNLRTPAPSLPGQPQIDETLEERLARQRQEEEAAERWLQEASDRAAQAAVTHNRATMLASRGKLSPQERDAAAAAYADAKQTLLEAKTHFESLSLTRAATGADRKRAQDIQEATGADTVPASLRIKNYEQQRQRVSIAAANLEATLLYAPADGIVTGLVAQPGAGVTPGQPCLFLAPLSKPVTITAHISEDIAVKLKKGQPCLVDVAGSPDSPFEGWVSAVFPRIRPAQANATEQEAFAKARMQVHVTLTKSTAPSAEAEENAQTPQAQLLLLPSGTKAEVTVLLREPLYGQAPASPAPASTPHQTAPAVPASPAAPGAPAPSLPGVPSVVVPPAAPATPAHPDAAPLQTPVPAPAEAQPVPVQVQVQPVPQFVPQTIPAPPQAPVQVTPGSAAPAGSVLPPITPAATPQQQPLLPPMQQPAELTGSPLPDPNNNPSIATPDALNNAGNPEPRRTSAP